TYRTAENRRATVTGRLQGIVDDAVVLVRGEETVHIALERIKQARLDYDWGDT
ncbi:MAG: hypothetical protein HPY69_17910, partial [Armatimonadetes bacterium]|nr:hypothetical protein [Armatimonadota bacterium]